MGKQVSKYLTLPHVFEYERFRKTCFICFHSLGPRGFEYCKKIAVATSRPAIDTIKYIYIQVLTVPSIGTLTLELSATELMTALPRSIAIPVPRDPHWYKLLWHALFLAESNNLSLLISRSK